MLTFFATLSNLPSLQSFAGSLLAEHPTFSLLFITLLLFGAAEALKHFHRPITEHHVERQVVLAKTGESS
jgi:hypothetical protein